MRRSSIFLLPLALAACEKAPSDSSPVTVAEATQIAERAEASFTKGDVKAIMAQYASNAVMIDAGSPDPSTDRKVQSGWAQTFVEHATSGLQGDRSPHAVTWRGRFCQLRY